MWYPIWWTCQPNVLTLGTPHVQPDNVRVRSTDTRLPSGCFLPNFRKNLATISQCSRRMVCVGIMWHQRLKLTHATSVVRRPNSQTGFSLCHLDPMGVVAHSETFFLTEKAAIFFTVLLAYHTVLDFIPFVIPKHGG